MQRAVAAHSGAGKAKDRPEIHREDAGIIDMHARQGHVAPGHLQRSDDADAQCSAGHRRAATQHQGRWHRRSAIIINDDCTARIVDRDVIERRCGLGLDMHRAAIDEAATADRAVLEHQQ